MTDRSLPVLLGVLSLFMLLQPLGGATAAEVQPTSDAAATSSADVESELRGPMGPQGQTSAPLAGSAQGSSAAGAAAPIKPPLHANANIASVTATVTQVIKKPLPRLRDDDVQFVEVTLRNDSQQVAVINGDAAQASVGATTAPAVGGRYLTTSARPGMTREKLVIVAALTIGSAGLAGPEVYEFVTASQHRKRSLGEAIGIDGTRHQVEADRFGVRVLMPGDVSVGWMAFSCEPDQAIKSVTVPLSFSRSLTPEGVLEVPVQPADNNGAAVPKSSSAQSAAAAQQALQDAAKSAAESGAPKAVPGMDGSMLQSQSTSLNGMPVSDTITAPNQLNVPPPSMPSPSPVAAPLNAAPAQTKTP